MVADGLLTRQRYREVPPRVDYELTERARDLVPVIAALSRWGHRWAWSEPRPSEAVDVGAVLRATCGLCPAGPTGVVELRVGDRRYWLALGRRGATLSERPPVDAADAALSGDEADWIAALGPQARTDRLAADGDAALLDRALAAFTPSGAATGPLSTWPDRPGP